MNFEFRFDIVWNNFPLLLEGIQTTIVLSLLTMALGTIIGLFVAIIRLRVRRAYAVPLIIYVEVFRGTPGLIQIVWIYYCLPIVTGLQLDAITSLVIAMALNVGSYLSEVFRAGIQGVDKGHIEAAAALGFKPGQITRRVVVPQAAYRMIPAIGNVFVSAIKLSSLCSVLGMSELMYQGQIIIANFFRPIEVFTVVAVIYLIMAYSTSLFMMYLEWKLAWVKRDNKSFWQSFKNISRSAFSLKPQGDI
ncbi:MAG: amino acid ABC transporter permease [Kordiimonadaceae bacterium]|nr:amino acid ABC transporter permease [Kordiimonadaceae bacterium]MBT6037322.1 amino acid ABC transporter permease [Kordiimonadaceae bacterium]MBT6329270.1 amino acid ABC transporter permease [Kordiimonadaceae bacterium]MBT7581751.1 amino acid ABC transporter permease [Kordiimonadaceae bacterium]